MVITITQQKLEMIIKLLAIDGKNGLTWSGCLPSSIKPYFRKIQLSKKTVIIRKISKNVKVKKIKNKTSQKSFKGKTMKLIFLFFSRGSCWWGHAHMMIGRIAESYLTRKQLQKVERILKYGEYPEQTITETSTWHDDLKDTYKMSLMGNWHFSDGPIIQSDNVTIPPPTFNVSTYLDSAWRTLSNSTTTDPWTWSFHLRGIIHFVGDVHTPHHNCALFNENFTKGDAGGNGYKLNCPYGSACNNIHFLWDAVGFYCPILNPLVQKYSSEFQENVTKLMEEIPESSLPEDLDTYDSMKWNKESFDVAEKYGYATPMNSWPSQEYIKTVQTQGKRRVALAGYRLGRILKRIADNVPIENEPNIREICMWVLNGILVVVSTCFGILTFVRRQHYIAL